MVRKRWRIREPMLVPANWQGSVEHFYHFLLGYFMPTVLWQQRTRAEAFTVRDCGPMNPWLDLLDGVAQVKRIQPGGMLQRTLSHRQERRIFWTWDDPSLFRTAELQAFRQRVLALTSINVIQSQDPQRVTVIYRGPSPDFYQSTRSENYGSAAMARTIPNIKAIGSALGSIGNVKLCDLASLPPREQVEIIANTDILVAQHGAALANMVWLRQGAYVIEIQPPTDPFMAQTYANLAAALGLEYVLVSQDAVHEAVSPPKIRDEAVALLKRPVGSSVPAGSQGLATRLRRILPRRDSWGRLIGC